MQTDHEWALQISNAMLAASPGDGTDDWPGEGEHNLARCYLEFDRIAELAEDRIVALEAESVALATALRRLEKLAGAQAITIAHLATRAEAPDG